MANLSGYDELIQQLRIKPNPLDEKGVSGLTIEWHPNPGYGLLFYFLALTFDGCHGKITRRAFHAWPAPSWQGEIACDTSLIKREITSLERLGLWDQDHFHAVHDDMSMVHPQYYIVRVKDCATRRDKTVCLVSPEDA